MAKAKWSGKYPCLCHGYWSLEIDGVDVSNKIPEGLRNAPMNTYGIYNSWHFVNWMETFKSYTNGLECDEWIEVNSDWLENITKDEKLQKEIFCAISEQDFRSGSCGGCI